MNNSPIGIFDSGLGGTSVLKIAKDILPNESFIYYGDHANAPYGIKNPLEIYDLSVSCVEFLLKKGAKAIVIACNTATSVSVKRLREIYKIPIICMEPAVKVGLKYQKDGYVLVMATPATLAQKKYLKLITRLNATEKVFNLPCAGFVELIERGIFEGELIEDFLRNKFAPIKNLKIDSCVLGCTHYPFTINSIKKVFNEMNINVPIVDGGEGTINHLKDVLAKQDMLNESNLPQSISLFTSSDVQSVLPLYEKAIFS